MHRFFDRSPQKVAEELPGKILQVGKKQATILSAKAQTSKDNANWIDQRPLFGPHPVDAYVAPYRGSHLLFLRTGSVNTCVRIESISIGDRVFTTPGKTCRALGINTERSGKVAFNGRAVTLRWP